MAYTDYSSLSFQQRQALTRNFLSNSAGKREHKLRYGSILHGGLGADGTLTSRQYDLIVKNNDGQLFEQTGFRSFFQRAYTSIASFFHTPERRSRIATVQRPSFAQRYCLAASASAAFVVGSLSYINAPRAQEQSSTGTNSAYAVVHQTGQEHGPRIETADRKILLDEKGMYVPDIYNVVGPITLTNNTTNKIDTANETKQHSQTNYAPINLANGFEELAVGTQIAAWTGQPLEDILGKNSTTKDTSGNNLTLNGFYEVRNNQGYAHIGLFKNGTLTGLASYDSLAPVYDKTINAQLI